MIPTPRSSTPKANLILRAGVYIIISYGSLLIAASLIYQVFDSLAGVVLANLIGAIVGNLFLLRVYEGLPLAAVGLGWSRASVRHLIIGMGGGIGAALLVVAVPVLAGGGSWQRTPGAAEGWGTLPFVLGLILFGALGEELLFRGYGFQILVPALGPYGTILPVAALFAAAHAPNPDVTWMGLGNTFLWGVLLCWAVVRSGDLWLATGLHAGWNWALPLLGVDLSGFTMRVTNYTVRWDLSDVWTGGTYGPEGGLLCSAAVVLLAFALHRSPLRPQKLALWR